MLITSIFSFSHNGFYPFQKEFVFKLHLFCRLQMLSIWTSLKICHLVKGWLKAFADMILVTSIFSFSQNAFKSLSPKVIKTQDCVSKVEHEQRYKEIMGIFRGDYFFAILGENQGKFWTSKWSSVRTGIVPGYIMAANNGTAL